VIIHFHAWKHKTIWSTYELYIRHASNVLGWTFKFWPYQCHLHLRLCQWLLGPLSHLPKLRYENLLYFISYIQSILSKTVSYTLVNQIMCSITLHRPLWEHLVNRRASWGTHLSKGFSTTIRTLVDITTTIPCLREMRKSWYEFGFMSCMCICMRQCRWLLLDDVNDLSYVSKICVNVYRQCGWLLFSNMVYVVCGFSCVDDIVYVVINILYVSIWFFLL
jgi:hypothetical protein